MEQEQIMKERISKMTDEEKKLRNLYLRDISVGKLYGPITGYPSIDALWLKYYDEDKVNFDLPNMNVFDYVYENNQDNLDKTALEYFGRKIR